MKILRYVKKERGQQLGFLEIEVLMDYGAGPQPLMIRLKHFKSSKSGKEFVAFPSEKNWDSDDKQYEDVVAFTQEGARFPFSNAVLQLLAEMPRDQLDVGDVEEQEFPF